MAVDFKDELHRLIDEIPDSRPDVARALLEVVLLLVSASRDDERLVRRVLHEIAEVQGGASDEEILRTRLHAVRERSALEPGEVVDSLARLLDSAPIDDEPLTPEEAAMLDARRAAAGAGPTLAHDEVGRKLQA